MKHAHQEVNAILTASTPESELIEHAAHGNGDAFALIMRRNNQRLFRTARSILRNDADAEDALQEAYLRAWRVLCTFRADARLTRNSRRTHGALRAAARAPGNANSVA